MYTDVMEAKGGFTFIKDRYGRYVHASEKFAEAAGLDSPSQIVNKTDNDLIWTSQADEFQLGDQLVWNGEAFDNVQEQQIQKNNVATIITTKYIVGTETKNPLLHGYFVDITGYYIEKKIGKIDLTNKCLNLGPEYGNTSLTHLEVETLRLVLRGHNNQEIAQALCRSTKCIESRIKKLKKKLQCKKKEDLSAFSIMNGLTFLAKNSINWS